MLRLLIFAVALGLLHLTPARANEPVSEPHPFSAEDLQAYFDPLVTKKLLAEEIAGGVVAAVKAGAPVFAKGYGDADVANKVPMTGDATLVRAGSISKLFAGIAVMQLVEQGKLDLDHDVNDYLNFRVETPPGGIPVTLRQLLTHRAGFEDHWKGVFSTADLPEPLGRYLEKSQPARLFANGDVTAYSNYGMALAGYIVERVSGEAFADYVDAHIFKPLGMAHSTFQQPLPTALAPLMSKGYRTSSLPPLDHFETISGSPAGALSTTGTDIGRFMLALIGGGTLDGAQILTADSLRQMMTPQATTPTGSLGLVFYESDWVGRRFIGHDGDTKVFHSALLLLPEAGIGFFVSYNSTGNDADGPRLLPGFIDRYVGPAPQADIPTEVLPGAATRAASVAGVYQKTRREDSSFKRIEALQDETLVAAMPDGEIKLRSALRSVTHPFEAGGQILHEIAPLRYRGEDDLTVGFYRLPSQPGLMMSIGTPIWVFERVPWYLDVRLVMPLLYASIALMASSLMAWPIAALLRWRRRPAIGPDRDARRYLLLIRLILLVDLAGVALAVESGPMTTPRLLTLYALAWLGVLGSGLAAFIAFRFWRDRIGSRAARLHVTALTAATLYFAAFCLVWRFAGTTLNY